MDEQNFLLKHKEDSLTDSNTDNTHSQIITKQESKTYLTKFEDVDVPTVIVKDIETYENKPWREKTVNISDYFNYGFNEENWNKYSGRIRSKLNDLKKAIEENRIGITQKDLIKYLFNMPADFGGMGEILDEKKYENLNFFEHKPSKNKALPMIEVRQGSICVPLERNENLIINYNPPTNVNNFSSINTNITPSQPTFTTQPPVNLVNPMTPFFNPHFVRLPGMEMHMPFPHFYLPRPVDYERTVNVTNISQYSPYYNLISSGQKQTRDKSKSKDDSERRKRKKEKKKKHKRSRSNSREKSRSGKRSKRSRSRSKRKRERSRSRSKGRSRKEKKRY